MKGHLGFGSARRYLGVACGLQGYGDEVSLAGDQPALVAPVEPAVDAPEGAHQGLRGHPVLQGDGHHPAQGFRVGVGLVPRLARGEDDLYGPVLQEVHRDQEAALLALGREELDHIGVAHEPAWALVDGLAGLGGECLLRLEGLADPWGFEGRFLFGSGLVHLRLLLPHREYLELLGAVPGRR